MTIYCIQIITILSKTLQESGLPKLIKAQRPVISTVVESSFHVISFSIKQCMILIQLFICHFVSSTLHCGRIGTEKQTTAPLNQPQGDLELISSQNKNYIDFENQAQGELKISHKKVQNFTATTSRFFSCSCALGFILNQIKLQYYCN